MPYKCIMIDHDDTVTPTSENHHYPSFKQSLKRLKPNLEISFDEYINYSFDPGFEIFLREILQLNEDEISFMYERWKEDTQDKIGIFYEEIKNFLLEFKKKGGRIAVVTHSNRKRIENDYDYNLGFIPKDIYSWELGNEKRKPNPFPIYDIKKKYGLSNEEILVIDDLKPGFLMAKEANVDFLWAGWAYKEPKFNEYMLKNAKYVCEDFESFKKIKYKIFI
ncbi:MAG: HAD hydrolase-like protein [Fusobacteriaceae bacterium]|nr:HAD hydrolase-like protein [Fusobacteriaceae bacterium]